MRRWGRSSRSRSERILDEHDERMAEAIRKQEAAIDARWAEFWSAFDDHRNDGHNHMGWDKD